MQNQRATLNSTHIHIKQKIIMLLNASCRFCVVDGVSTHYVRFHFNKIASNVLNKVSIAKLSTIQNFNFWFNYNPVTDLIH